MEAENKNTFHFELVSPEEKLMSLPVHKVTIPGVEGHFGVLAKHMTLLAAARPGVIRIYKENNKESEDIFVTGGFADIANDVCTFLAEETVHVSELNQADLEKNLQDLREDLGMAESDIDKTRINREISMTLAKLEAVKGQS